MNEMTLGRPMPYLYTDVASCTETSQPHRTDPSIDRMLLA